MFQIGTATDYLDLLSKLDTFLTATGSAFGLAYTGTGNGTMTGYKGGSASVAETFTITATSATNFTVTGSVSGSLSAATVGTPYTGTTIQFTLTAGGTAFVSGDSFVLSTAPKWTGVRRAMGANCTASSGQAGADQPNEAIVGVFGSTHRWLSGVAAPVQFTLTLFEAETIVEYVISTNSSIIGSAPSAWTFEYWNGSTWVVLDTRSGQTSWASPEQRAFAITSPVSATLYRLNISAAQFGNPPAIHQILLRRAASGIDVAPGYCLWMAPGNDGLGQFYLGVHTFQRPDSDYYDWEVLSLDGYVSSLDLSDQPGLQRNGYVPLWTASIPYWFIVNGRRVVVIAKLGSQYQCLYLGCYLPYFTPAELPYPICLGYNIPSGSATYQENNFNQVAFRYSNSSSNRSFVHSDKQFGPSVSTLRLRKIDGNWSSLFARSADNPAAVNYQDPLIWPYAHGLSQLDTNIDGTYALWPVSLHDCVSGSGTIPNNMGELDGIFAISGLAGSAESTVKVAGLNYLMVQNVALTTRQDYFVVRLD
jgi:hypothetical protein